MAKPATIEFQIVTAEGVIYTNPAERVTIPTENGEITVLPNHAPMVSLLKAGSLVAVVEGHSVAIAVSSGIVEIRPDNKIYILADTAERAEDIDIARAEEARRRAEELLKQQVFESDVDFARIQAMIEKELARLHVAKTYK